MKKFLSVVVFLYSCLSVVNGQVYDRVFTTDGRILEGYISDQIPGSQLTVRTYRSLYTIFNNDIEEISRTEVPLIEMQDAIREYFDNRQDSSMVISASIRTKEQLFTKVCLLEEGYRCKFISADKASVDIPWKNVEKIEKAVIDFSSGRGLYDVVVLADGNDTLEGQLVEQNLKNGIISFRDFSGNRRTFLSKEIKKMEVKPLDVNDSIFNQALFLDRVIKKDGSYYQGILIARQMGKNVTILTNDFEEVIIPNTSIRSYAKSKNKSYSGDKEAIQKKLVELEINGRPEIYDRCEPMPPGTRYAVLTPVDSIRIQVPQNQKVTIKLSAEAIHTSAIKVSTAQKTKERTVSLKGFSIKQKQIVEMLTFSKNKDSNFADINVLNNDGNQISFEIYFSAPGFYVVYLDGVEKNCIAIEVK